MLDVAALQREFTSRQAEMLADLQTLSEIETPSTDKAMLDAFIERFVPWVTAFSRPQVERIPAPANGDHLRLTWGGRTAPLLLVGHYDTVWPAGTLATIPFTHIDDVVRGPGVFDMKGGIVQGLWAIRALVAGGFSQPIEFIINSDEEIGSVDSRPLIESAARRASSVFVLEPSYEGALITQRKGVGIFSLDVTGHAVHAGRDYYAGVSAIDELARFTLQLHAQSDREAGTTVNVGVVAGGTRTNVVAARARAQIDVRVVTDAEGARFERAIRALRPHHPAAGVTVGGGMNRPPMPRSAGTGALFAHAQGAAAELGIELRESATGGGSDGNFCAAVGRPVLDGLGPVGAGAHAADEHLIASQMAPRAALLAGILTRAAALAAV